MDRPVATKVLLNGNGTYTVQATGLTPGTVYELRVSGGMSTYGLTIDLGGRVAAVDDYTSGQLPAATAAVPKPATTQTLYIAKPLLFQFILSATATGSGTGGVVRMTIVNEAGNIVLTVATRAGESSTGPAVLLVPGAYTVRFSSEGGANSPPMTFGVQGELLSDPIGPAKSDTTLSPRYINPGDPKSYLYPGGVLSYLPFLWVKLLGI